MFKYVSEIISQFSKSQKILALLILSLSIIIISVAPSFIDSVTTDREELELKISNSDKKIKKLEGDINLLDSNIRVNQKTCTDDAFKREIDFKKMLQEIQDELIRKEYTTSKIKKLDSFHLNDTTAGTIIEKTIIYEPRLNPLIKKIEGMKNSIKDK